MVNISATCCVGGELINAMQRHGWCCHRKIGPGNNGPRTKIFTENIGPPDHFCLKKMVRLENIGPTLISCSMSNFNISNLFLDSTFYMALVWSCTSFITNNGPRTKICERSSSRRYSGCIVLQASAAREVILMTSTLKSSQNHS